MPIVNIRDDLTVEIKNKWNEDHPFEDKLSITHIITRICIEYLNKINEE